jgi:ribosomal-protein-alanine N-acetyltransferase
MNAVLRPRPAPWHRPMTVADLDAVLALEVAAYSHPWSRGNFIDSLAAAYCAELRLDGDGSLLGYFVALPGFEEMHLLNLTVAPARQRGGQGRALLNGLIAQARRRGDQVLGLEVRPSNAPARGLYRAFGFVEVGCRRNYYPAAHGRREDALVLRLALDGAAAAPPGAAGDPDALV